MATLLFTVGGAVVNALAFSGTNLVFNRLLDHGEEEHKRHHLAEEEIQRARDEWNEDQMKLLDFINKRLREQNKTRAYINDTDEAMVEYYQIFGKKKKKNQIFIINQRPKKMVNYYLLQWVQAWHHIPFTSTLNK